MSMWRRVHSNPIHVNVSDDRGQHSATSTSNRFCDARPRSVLNINVVSLKSIRCRTGSQYTSLKTYFAFLSCFASQVWLHLDDNTSPRVMHWRWCVQTALLNVASTTNGYRAGPNTRQLEPREISSFDLESS